MAGDYSDILRNSFLLQHLSEEECAQLLKFARLQRYAAGQTLFQKGDDGDSLLGIISGHIRISTLSAEGREVVLNILNPGELFGEIALIDGKERTADASAMDNCEVLVIHRRDFMPFLQQRPELCTRLMVVLCERIRWVSALHEDAMFLSLTQRLAKHLLRLASTYGEETPEGMMIDLKLSQQELGNILGATRESINKQIRAWEEDGILKRSRGRIVIADADALEDATMEE
jgi:CRP-like cAMP-binding protein